MKKLVLVLFLYLILSFKLETTAQQDSLFDVLPFNVGTEWIYSFGLTSANSTSHSATTDTGKVSYIAIGNSIFQDTTVWHLLVKRKFTRYSYGYPSRFIEDSKFFDIVEINQGQHKLYTPVYDDFSLFPFFSDAPDSESFYRYRQADYEGKLILDITFYPSPSNPTFGYNVIYSLTKDIGIINSRAYQFKGFPSAWISTKYYYKDLKTHSTNAHLIIEDSNFEITTLFGESKELKIPVQNDGIQPLNISNIQFSDARISAKNIPSEIPGVTIDTLILEFNSPIPETLQATIVINSNSITITDTIYILAKAISASRINLPSWINFDAVLSGKESIRNLTITNTGNIPWNFDSIKTEFKEFSIQSVTSPLAPNQSGSLIISFIAPDTGNGIWNKMIIYSNSLSSPDTIMMMAIYVTPAQLSFSATSLDFGRVKIGEQKELLLKISNAKEYSVDIRRYNPVKPFVCPQSEYFWINGSDFCVDTIVFKPESRGKYHDKVIYETSETGGIVSRIDTIYISGIASSEGEIHFTLYQNFPNPFNSATIIWFDLESKRFVNLKIFDVLGNEVATLVNEYRPAGTYEIEFNPESSIKHPASGVYLYRLQVGDFVETKKMIYLK